MPVFILYLTTNSGYTIVSIHPDGLLVGLGTSTGTVRVYDIKAMSSVASFEGHEGSISGISFSENGYFVSVTTKESKTFKVWDLRKLKCVGEVNIDAEGGKGLRSDFDFSAQYLGVSSGNSLQYVFCPRFNQHTMKFD